LNQWFTDERLILDAYHENLFIATRDSQIKKCGNPRVCFIEGDFVIILYYIIVFSVLDFLILIIIFELLGLDVLIVNFNNVNNAVEK